MSEDKIAPEKSSPCFVCAEEAAALLNCVAEKKFNEMRCYPLIKKLRACIEKKVRTTALSQMIQELRSKLMYTCCHILLR